jgi:hypothetical protein
MRTGVSVVGDCIHSNTRPHKIENIGMSNANSSAWELMLHLA